MRSFHLLALIFFFSFFPYLKSNGQGIVPLLQTGHSGKINCMALSSDGKFLATGSDDKTVKVRNLATGQIVKNFEGHVKQVNAVSFSEDGMYLLSASSDGAVRIWEFVKNPDNKILDAKYDFIKQQALRTNMMTVDAVKGQYEQALEENYGCLQTYNGHQGAITSLGRDNSLKNFITLSTDNTIRFWDPLKSKAIGSVATNAASLVLSADGSKYYTVEADGSVSIYKFSSKEKTGSFPEASKISSLIVSKDKKWIGGIDESQTIHIWDAAKHTKIATIPGMSPVSELVFLSGKTSLVFGTENGLKEYDFKTQTLVKTIKLPDILSGALVVTDDHLVCGIANEKDLYFIDIRSGIVKNHWPSLSANYGFNMLSNDGRKTFSFDSKTNTLSSVDIFTGKVQQTILPKTHSYLRLSEDSKAIASIDKKQINLYNTEDLKLFASISVSNSVNDMAWPEGSENIFLQFDNGKIYSYSLNTKKETELFTDRKFSSAYFIRSNIAGLLKDDGQLSLMELKSGKITHHIPDINNNASEFCPAANLLAFSNSRGNIEIWNASLKKKVKEIQTGTNEPPLDIRFSGSGKFIAALFNNGRISVFEIETGYHTAGRLDMKKLSKINPLSFTSNDKFIFCTSQKNSLILWNWKEDKDIQILQGKNGAAIFCYDNYYIVSNKGVDLIGFKKGTEYYTFEQFDLHYNRPDKVLQTLGYADENLIKAYRQAYNKRLKKLGFKNSFQGIGIHIPQATVLNISEIQPTTKEDKVIFKIKAADTDYMLRSIVISVNGVPEGGVKGFDISDKKLKEYEGTFEVKLSQGENNIKIWSMNEKGAESYKKSIQIMCEKPSEKPSLYLVVIGVSEYKNPSLNLNYAAKDGRDLIRTLLSQKDQYKEIIIDSLMNAQATIEKITGVKKHLMQSKADDRVIIFFAGHGLLDPNLDYYLATHDVDFTNPAAKGLPYEKLEDLLDGIPARNKLLLMDACHSGELDKEETQVTTEQTTVKEDVTFRAVPNSTTVKTIGLNNSFEMMKQLFSDLRKGNGTTVISSAGGAEYAMEGENWNNGVFTYCLLNALKEKKADIDKDNKITLTELQDYLQYNVSELTNGKQKPTSRAENISNDWQIW